MSYPRWPATVPPKDIMFHPALASRSGGRSIVGTEQVVQSGAGYWTAKFTVDVFRSSAAASVRRGADKEIAFRAMLAYCEGRANPFLIGPSTLRTSPALVAHDPGPIVVPHSDGTTFSDGSKYRTQLTSAKVVSNVASGLNVIAVNMLGGHSPEPGQYFSVIDRLYLIKVASPQGSNIWNLTVWPTVREPLVANTPAEFDDPVCRVRFASDDTAQLMMSSLKYGSATADLVEASM